jgi:hypothetical protein
VSEDAALGRDWRTYDWRAVRAPENALEKTKAGSEEAIEDHFSQQQILFEETEPTNAELIELIRGEPRERNGAT